MIAKIIIEQAERIVVSLLYKDRQILHFKIILGCMKSMVASRYLSLWRLLEMVVS